MSPSSKTAHASMGFQSAEFASTCLGCLLVSLGHEESCLETPRPKHGLPAQGLLKEP